ncbi:MAG: PH domain-containing protein [Candidatus Saccharibacteria bacterium]|nr:PH domain-containing protein [Candidatus Saccharibacteria bacterium]
MSDAKEHDKAFEGQREGEEVIKIFRRHIIAMRKGFYCLLVPLALSSIPPLIWQTNLELFLLPIAGLGLGLLLFAYHFIIWYYTVFVLTNQRLRQITQKGFFGSDVVELKLSKIHNISYNIPGFSGEMFGFGTIVIQTYVGDLVIRNVEHPEKIYNLLQDATEAAERGVNEEANIEVTA